MKGRKGVTGWGGLTKTVARLFEKDTWGLFGRNRAGFSTA
jgi:hypothetical protein